MEDGWIDRQTDVDTEVQVFKRIPINTLIHTGRDKVDGTKFRAFPYTLPPVPSL